MKERDYVSILVILASGGFFSYVLLPILKPEWVGTVEMVFVPIFWLIVGVSALLAAVAAIYLIVLGVRRFTGHFGGPAKEKEKEKDC